jgi:predicted thioesterase
MEDVKMNKHEIKVGLFKDVRRSTHAANLQSSAGSEELYYLVSASTIVNMIIDASSEMLDELVSNECITIGTHFELNHEKPTLSGEFVNFKLIVKKVDNNHIYLDFIGTDSQGQFCTGKTERYVVNKAKLMQTAYDRFSTKNDLP